MLQIHSLNFNSNIALYSMIETAKEISTQTIQTYCKNSNSAQ